MQLGWSVSLGPAPASALWLAGLAGHWLGLPGLPGVTSVSCASWHPGPSLAVAVQLIKW